MNDASFWTNFFGQFKDLNDWIKALILILPFATLTIITCFLAWLRHKEKRTPKEKPHEHISQQRNQEGYQDESSLSSKHIGAY